MVILKIKFAKIPRFNVFFHFIKKYDTIDILFESPRVTLGLSNDACFLLKGSSNGKNQISLI